MYSAYNYQWPEAWRRNPHVHYASDVRPEGKYTTKLPFHQLNYHGTEQAQHDPSRPDPLHTPRHTRQMLPVRPALRHLAPPPVLPRRSVPLPPQTPVPTAYAYATPHVHQRPPAASAPQQAAPRPPSSASNAHSVPHANPLPAAPPARPVLGRMPIWSQSRNRWEGDLAYEAQAPTVPTSSSAPAVAQTAVPPAATQTAIPPPPVYQQPQSVHHQAPSSVQTVQFAQSAPASAQNLSAPLRNPGYAAQTEAPPADAVEREERSASTVEYIMPVLRSDHQTPVHQQPVANQPTTCSAAPHANSDVAASGNNTTSLDGHLVLDNSTSHMHAEGVYGLSALLSPWEAIHFLNVTVPVSVNDLQRILCRAHNLRTASFAAITPKTERLGHEDKIRLPALQRLTIKSIQSSIRGVLKDLVTPKLNYLHVSYAQGSTYYLWSDEQDYYRLFFKLRWYLYHRAAQLRELLQETVGSGWRVTIR